MKIYSADNNKLLLEIFPNKKGIKERLNWDDYFMNMAYLVAERSTCIRRKVGAVLIKDNHILSTGYNGAPSGISHCEDIGCLREKENISSGQRHELCRGVHAEQNAIIQAAIHGVSIKDSILYCTNSPCSICAKMIINAGIKKIIYNNGYPDKLGGTMLEEAGIIVIKTKIDRALYLNL